MSRSSATGLAGAGALLVAASLPTPWYTNHLGLYGEEFGPQAQHLHNFPQAFTHLARPSTWTAAVGSRPRWMTASLAA